MAKTGTKKARGSHLPLVAPAARGSYAGLYRVSDVRLLYSHRHLFRAFYFFLAAQAGRIASSIPAVSYRRNARPTGFSGNRRFSRGTRAISFAISGFRGLNPDIKKPLQSAAVTRFGTPVTQDFVCCEDYRNFEIRREPRRDVSHSFVARKTT